jgi:ketosteroid isomerase-like protein
MTSNDNIKTIQSVYEAFGRGDVATILDALADDVDWASDAIDTSVPWYGVKLGKAQVADFFGAFGSSMDVDEFNPVSYAANDTEVHTLVKLRSRAKTTGVASEMYLHHYFRFADGLITYYRGSEDSAQTVAALRG